MLRLTQGTVSFDAITLLQKV